MRDDAKRVFTPMPVSNQMLGVSDPITALSIEALYQRWNHPACTRGLYAGICITKAHTLTCGIRFGAQQA